MRRIISIANQKGGVGKTTTAVNLAACLAAMQYRTLLIDLDAQGNASSGVGCRITDEMPTTYDVLSGTVSIDDALTETVVDNLWLVPSDADLAGADVELVTLDGRERKLREQLEAMSTPFDYVLIDCPPSLSMLTLNALVAADSLLVPVQAEYYALEGLARLMQTVERVQYHYQPALQIEGLLVTMHDARTNLSRQVEDEVRSHFGDKTFETVIPRNIRLAESPSHGKPIILYDVESAGARSYMSLAREFVHRNLAPQAAR